MTKEQILLDGDGIPENATGLWCEDCFYFSRFKSVTTEKRVKGICRALPPLTKFLQMDNKYAAVTILPETQEKGTCSYHKPR